MKINILANSSFYRRKASKDKIQIRSFSHRKAFKNKYRQQTPKEPPPSTKKQPEVLGIDDELKKD